MAYDYFAAQEALVNRLKAQVPELKSAVGAGRGTGTSLPRPAVAVFHESYEHLGRGTGQSLLRQRWRVSLTVDDMNDRDGSRARSEAGPLITQIISALAGWAPGSSHSPMEILDGGEEAYEDGQARFHLHFASNVTL